MTSCIATPRSLLSELEHLSEQDRQEILAYAVAFKEAELELENVRSGWDHWCHANGERISEQLKRGNHK